MIGGFKGVDQKERGHQAWPRRSSRLCFVFIHTQRECLVQHQTSREPALWSLFVPIAPAVPSSEDESIDSAFARFNTIVTSLKALDEGCSSKNYVRKFLGALHPKWRARMIVKKDSEIVKAKGERRSLALKAKRESSDEECSTSRSEDEEYAMMVRDFKKCGDPNHFIGEYPKPPKDKNQRAFIRDSWSDSGEEDDKKVKDETCLVAQASSEMSNMSEDHDRYNVNNQGRPFQRNNARGNVVAGNDTHLF
ncbi:hypothetical protein Tco_0489333 [Tanacetum coccineum]